MLRARKANMWKSDYEISVDGRPLVTWRGSTWRRGGHFEIEGRRYEVRANMWGSTYGMTDEAGERVASADRVGHKQWTVEAGGQTLQFQRASMWRPKEDLIAEGRPVGSIKRTSSWRSAAEADLPGLPVPVQVFAFAVVLTMWDWAAASVTATG